MAKKKRPNILSGETHKIPTDCGNFYITLNKNKEDELSEIRMQLGKSGSCIRSLLEVIAVFFSMMLQDENTESRDKMRKIKKHLEGMSCGNPFVIGGNKYLSCIDLLAQLCIKEWKEEVKEQ